MLRTIISRSFVSSVLLTRTWENESVAVIRKELKSRGLPLKGNKATLILRIQEHDKAKTLNALREPPVIRQLSTEATPSQGLNITLPDLWQPVPEIPVQIPYVPDFWDSSVVPAGAPVVEEPLPKLLVVAGAATHVSGSPSHNFHDEHAPFETPASSQTSVPKEKADDGIFGDITDDLGLPRPNEMKTALWKLFA
ncbi:hypothetical protein H0H92_010962 [Tricholoma furcatifolium]|nr:hypothetical protein H0H92_010962 [Tricholoma furcatifolium]